MLGQHPILTKTILFRVLISPSPTHLEKSTPQLTPTGFKLNVTKRSAKIIKAVEEHPPKLGKTLGNLEKMTQKKHIFKGSLH